MEAKDLMVGDWVQVPCLIDNTENYNAWCQIKQLRDCDLDVIGFKELSYDEICPIPLTPEILEKNGWVKNLYSAESYDNEELECLSLWVGEDGKNKWWWHVGVELVTPINYVHELQHALRLCGIEKEVKLWNNLF